MNKFMKRVLPIALLILILIIILSTKVMAVNANEYDPRGRGGDAQEAIDGAGVVLGYIRVVGIIIAIGAIMVIGIKYMFTSIEEKAEYKKKTIPLIIGIILITAIVNILDMIYEAVYID